MKTRYEINGFERRGINPVSSGFAQTLSEAKTVARKLSKFPGIVHIEIDMIRVHPETVEIEFLNEILYYDYCTKEHDGMPRDGWFWTHWN